MCRCRCFALVFRPTHVACPPPTKPPLVSFSREWANFFFLFPFLLVYVFKCSVTFWVENILQRGVGGKRQPFWPDSWVLGRNGGYSDYYSTWGCLDSCGEVKGGGGKVRW